MEICFEFRKKNFYFGIYYVEINCICMIIDFIGMNGRLQGDCKVEDRNMQIELYGIVVFLFCL